MCMHVVRHVLIVGGFSVGACVNSLCLVLVLSAECVCVRACVLSVCVVLSVRTCVQSVTKWAYQCERVLSVCLLCACAL